VSDESAHIIDDLGSYLLNGLDATERGRVEAHLGDCDACARRAAEYRHVVGMLPLGLRPIAPPPDGWSAISSALHARRERYRRARWAAASAVAAALLVWNVTLQNALRRYDGGPQVEKLARRPARLVILTGVAQPQASARIFAAVDGRSGHMAISGLAPSPAGRVYQLWFVARDGSAKSAAAFRVDRDGRAWVVIDVPGPLEDMQAIRVTEEGAPESATPTGVPLLEARDWR